MVNRVRRLRKLGKYNRQVCVVINRYLNATLSYYNKHNKYNKNIDVGIKEPITAKTYSRPSNDENDSFCLFLAYFLHLVVNKNRISGPLSPLHVRIIISNLFLGVYVTSWYRLKSIFRMPSHVIE